MNLPNDYEVEGQLSIFDVFSQDLWSGRMYQEHLAQTKAKTSEQFLKKFAELRIKPPQFLCLKMEDGHQADASWEMGGALLGEYMTHSFGEFPREERESLLSQILEVNPQQKYCLSAKACQGILNRAKKRDKALPPQLEEVLKIQSVSKNEPDVMGGGKGILIQHERTGALSTLNNQSVLCGFDAHNILETGNQCQTLTSGRNDTHSIPTICEVTPEIAATLYASYYKGCGERQGVERTVVCIGKGQTAQLKESDKANTLDCMHEQQAVVVYGLDRASFNQGENAQFDFSIKEELAQTLVSKGPGGGTSETVGALCRCDYKGVGNQYVSDGKCIIQSVGQSSNGQSNADKRR